VKPETEAWITSADEDWEAARVLHGAGLYRSAVYQVHLHIEKLLKAIVIESLGRASVPYSHDLPRLLSLTQLAALVWLQLYLARLSGTWGNCEIRNKWRRSRAYVYRGVL
jgi:HEPN domain-containing protein